MALNSPALTLSIEALFGHIKPALDIIDALGPTDFSAEAPGIDIKPGSTVKVPLSTVGAALAFNEETNNYLTGGNTDWATLTASHYLQGFDLKGTDLDNGAHLSASPAALAEELGFKKVIVLSGMTARAAIVPYGSLGFMARVPALVADYKESGVETDPDSGLSIGIVVATEQKINREVVNGDLWFGCAAVSASADAAKTHGIIKVGTAS